MLAPLKDRSILEREADDAPDAAETLALRLALRQSRQAQKRAATLSTRQIVELTNAANRLSEHNRQLQQRLDELENGQTLLALGQQLMALREENDALIAAAHRVWQLDRTLSAAHRECERLARQRDNAVDRLQAGASSAART